MTFIEFKDLEGNYISVVLEKISSVAECDIGEINKGSIVCYGGHTFYSKESKIEILDKIQKKMHNIKFNDKFDEKVLND